MRPWAWLLVFMLVGAVVCVSAIPQTDIPETSYNEVDTPLNQAPPVVQGMKFVRPVLIPAVLPRETTGTGRTADIHDPVHNMVCKPFRRNSRSFQNLLCTFLI